MRNSHVFLRIKNVSPPYILMYVCKYLFNSIHLYAGFLGKSPTQRDLRGPNEQIKEWKPEQDNPYNNQESVGQYHYPQIAA